MKYTPKFRIPYPDDGDLISNYLPMFNNAMDIINTHTHKSEVDRLNVVINRLTKVQTDLADLKKKKWPGMQAMRVTQVEGSGFRFPTNHRFDPRKTAISVVDEARCIVYYNPNSERWVIAEVDPTAAEKESGVTIPGKTYTIVIYSTSPRSEHTPPSVLPDSDDDDTATSAKAKKKKTPKDDDAASNKNNADDKDYLRDPVWVLGDSLTVGSDNAIEKRYKKGSKIVKVTAKVGKTTADGVQDLDQAPDNSKTWVVALGTNDSDPDTFKRAARKIIKRAGKRNVYWMNVVNFSDTGRADRINKVIKELVKENDNVFLINFAAEARGKRSMFAGDGVHMDAAGYDWRAKFYGPRNPNG